MFSRKRIFTTGIVLASFALIGVLAWAAYQFLIGFAFAGLIGELLEDEALFDLSHRSVQVVGDFSDSDAESNYNFVTECLGIQFLDGTVVDQHDNAWDRIVCCFQIESHAISPSFPPEKFTACERGNERVIFPDLSETNRDVPSAAAKYDVIIPDDPYAKIVYHHPETDRIWIYFGYRPPMD
jgi:hypothetical protein